MSNNPAFLDVEDDERRQERIGTLLQRLDATSPSSSLSSNPLNLERERLPGPVEPPIELLERVQAFLPVISASNDALSQHNPADINMENVPAHEERYIEMNLGLGVFEAKPRIESGSPPSSESDAASSDSDSDSDSSYLSQEGDSESDSSSSDNGDYESDAESLSGSSVDMKPISTRPIKSLPRRMFQEPKLQV